MIEPKKKVSKARRDKRRFQNSKATAPNLVECNHCHALKVSHRVCEACGFYDGRQVVAVEEAKN